RQLTGELSALGQRDGADVVFPVGYRGDVESPRGGQDRTPGRAALRDRFREEAHENEARKTIRSPDSPPVVGRFRLGRDYAGHLLQLAELGTAVLVPAEVAGRPADQARKPADKRAQTVVADVQADVRNAPPGTQQQPLGGFEAQGVEEL